MMIRFGYVWLLLLAICCWHCMARHVQDKKKGPGHSHSKEAHSHSKEGHSHSEEDHSHSKEAHSHSHEAHSHSHEDDGSKEKDRTCRDKKKNHGETDIDCGGKKCGKCADKKSCKKNEDCISNYCEDKICAQKPTKPTKPTKTTTAGMTTSSVTTTRTSSTMPPTTSFEVPSTTTFEEPSTTTFEEPSTTPVEEPSTTIFEEPSTTIFEEPSTTIFEEPSTTIFEEPSTTIFEEVSTTPVEESSTIAFEEPAMISQTCDFECKNGGTCTSRNHCECATGFSGPTCEVQSVGLCLSNETFNSEPILLVTFGSGSALFSTATPASFNFSTTYRQRFEARVEDGQFGLVNKIYNHNNAWHTNATDHSEDDNGYMYLVNADFTPGQFYNGRVDNLCVGLRYEFSVYLANLLKIKNKIRPNVLFEVRSAVDNTLLAQLESGDVVEHDTLTWEKYGFSFIAPTSSAILSMISNAPGGGGNDIVIDDIALRVCASEGSGFCPSN